MQNQIYNNFSGTKNNLDHLDPVNRLKMRRDQELNIPNFVKSIEQNIEQFDDQNYNTNLPYNNPTINGIPNRLPKNQNIMIQPKMHNHPQLKQREKFTNIPIKKKKSSFNIKEYLIMLLVFIILSIKPIRILTRTAIPFVKNFQNEIPSVIFRGLLFLLIMFIYRRFK